MKKSDHRSSQQNYGPRDQFNPVVGRRSSLPASPPKDNPRAYPTAERPDSQAAQRRLRQRAKREGKP